MCSTRFVLAGHFWHFTILDQNIIIMGEQNSNRSYIPAVSVISFDCSKHTKSSQRECMYCITLYVYACVCVSVSLSVCGCEFLCSTSRKVREFLSVCGCGFVCSASRKAREFLSVCGCVFVCSASRKVREFLSVCGCGFVCSASKKARESCVC